MFTLIITVTNLLPSQSANGSVWDLVTHYFKDADFFEHFQGVNTNLPADYDKPDCYMDICKINLDLNPDENFPQGLRYLQERLTVGKLTYFVKNSKGKKVFEYREP
jgi:hypothetical protein